MKNNDVLKRKLSLGFLVLLSGIALISVTSFLSQMNVYQRILDIERLEIGRRHPSPGFSSGEKSLQRAAPYSAAFDAVRASALVIQVGAVILALGVGGVFYAVMRILRRQLLELNTVANCSAPATGHPLALESIFCPGDMLGEVKNRIRQNEQSRKYYENIVLSMADALVVVDRDFKITRVNKATSALLGYPEEELLQKDFRDVFLLGKKEQREEYWQILEAGFLENKEVNCRTKEGTVIPVLFSAQAMVDDRGEVREIVGIGKDVTTYKLTEAALEQVNKKLKANEHALMNILSDLKQSHQDLRQVQMQLLQSEKLAAIGQLAAGVAHEINNPVGFIGGNLQIIEDFWAKYSRYMEVIQHMRPLLEEGKLVEAQALSADLVQFERQHHLDSLVSEMSIMIQESKNGVDRITKIIKDLRTFARGGSGEKVAVKIEEIIDSILSIVTNEIRFKAELKREYGTTPLVRCQTQEMGQVFINLLINAVQAIKDKGVITVKTFVSDDMVHVEIHDTGVGIPADKMKDIFNPFYTTKPVGKGTGLGLSISREIVQKQGGEIVVQSEHGKGSVFTVKIPSDKNSNES